ncbi:MAG TPA: hypothetical protein VNK92_00915 [Vicinamibacterales bacterium]|nr:hypothetical protein [Vicinamibacterales bacterium]
MPERSPTTSSPAEPQAAPARPRDLLPHFEVATLDGRRARYGEIWQRRNLVLVLLDGAETREAQRYARRLAERAADFAAADTALVCTADPIAGLPSPGVIVADRWGEIVHVAAAPAGRLDELPQVDELLDWVRFVRMQCPECPP